ncbi:MAG: molybdopterin-guanine dinucleotide biosynthesis protein B [Candidatus Odinarchaeum yellowstonii]|uniref:Molybdopterin-guanine dinucleotide biosynthesis protein B n=1 Tax=Odinarchaeota yellowstonii (strain LCB_4) TaxID=1841599 RepID=A0AAF0IBH4_ODILC|nr:MAG: molybdopterin-guanine dinucleotide biosynthesis protein B [Candidatus Odinarchaeum yellowstonii]
MHPIICVLGKKDTGKTSLAERVISYLVERKIKVAAAKHTSHKIELDKEGTDSYRFQKAGANPVILFSAEKTAIYISDHTRLNSIEDIEKNITTPVDVLVLEGFSEIVQKNSRVAKIICYTEREQLQEYFNTVSPPILGYYSYNSVEEKDRFYELMRRVENYIEEFKTVYNFYKLLPRLDCLKCGCTCFEMAERIYKKEKDLSDCPAISEGTSKLEIVVKGVNIPLKSFPAKIIRKTVIALISTLKQVDENLDGKITINIS